MRPDFGTIEIARLVHPGAFTLSLGVNAAIREPGSVTPKECFHGFDLGLAGQSEHSGPIRGRQRRAKLDSIAIELWKCFHGLRLE